MSKNHNNNQNNQNQRQGDQNAGYWIGFFAKIVLAVAMLLYLGMHSYNFFTFTFQGDQWIFAILGLFTTSIGFLLWLSIYLYIAKDGLQKAIAIIMIFVSLGGEFAVAAFDMYMNISGQLTTQKWTIEDLRNMSYIIAGLALLNGLALVIDIAGKQIFDDLRNVKSRGGEQQNQNQSQQSNVNPNINVTPETEKPYAYLRGEPVTQKEAQEMVNAGFEDATGKGGTTPPNAGGGAKKAPFPQNGQKR